MAKITLLGAARALRRTALFVGLALMLALVLGSATVALAAVPGDPLKLGRVNTINKLTSLVGSVDGAMLRIDNNSSGTSATALELQVEPGKAPMKVNSQTKVTDLNADQLDGEDSAAFFRGSTYIVTSPATDNSGGSLTNILVRCDVGDVALGGGYAFLEPNEGTVRADGPHDVSTVNGIQEGWNVQWVNATPSLDNNVVAMVRCADFPPANANAS
jgi:hypothetical protein